MTEQCQKIINTPAEYNNLLQELTRADVKKDGKIKIKDGESLYVFVKDEETKKRLAIKTTDPSITRAYAKFFQDSKAYQDQQTKISDAQPFKPHFECVINDSAVLVLEASHTPDNFVIKTTEALQKYQEKGKQKIALEKLKLAFKEENIPSDMVVHVLSRLIQSHRDQGKKIDKNFLNSLAKEAIAGSPYTDILLSETLTYINADNLKDFADAVDNVYESTKDKDKADAFLVESVIASAKYQAELVLKTAKGSDALRRAFDSGFNAESFLQRVKTALSQNDIQGAKGVLKEYQQALNNQVFISLKLEESQPISDDQKLNYLVGKQKDTLEQHVELQLLTALTAFDIHLESTDPLSQKIRRLVRLIRSPNLSERQAVYKQSFGHSNLAALLVREAGKSNVKIPSSLRAEVAYYASLFHAISDTSKRQRARDLFKQASAYSPDLSQKTEYHTRLGLLSGILTISDPTITSHSLFSKAQDSLNDQTSKPEDKEGLYLAWILSNLWKISNAASQRKTADILNQIRTIVDKMGEENLNPAWSRFREQTLTEYVPYREVLELARHFEEPARLSFSKRELSKFEDSQNALDLRSGQREIAERIEKKLDHLGDSLQESLEELEESSKQVKTDTSISAEFAESLFKLFFEKHFKGALGHLETLMLAVFDEAQKGDVQGFLKQFQLAFREAIKVFKNKLPFLNQLAEIKLLDETMKFINGDEGVETLTKSPEEFIKTLREKLTQDIRNLQNNSDDIASSKLDQLGHRIKLTHPDLANYIFILARYVKDQNVTKIIPEVTTTFSSQVINRLFNIEDVLPGDLKLILSSSRDWLERAKKADLSDPNQLANLSKGLTDIGLIPDNENLKESIEKIRDELTIITNLVDINEIKNALTRGDKDVWIRADMLLEEIDRKLQSLSSLNLISLNDKTKKALSHSRQAIQMARLVLSPFIPGSAEHKQIVCFITRIQNTFDKINVELRAKLKDFIPLIAKFLADPTKISHATEVVKWLKDNGLIKDDPASDKDGLQKQIAKALGYTDWTEFKSEVKDLVGKEKFEDLIEDIDKVQQGHALILSRLETLQNLNQVQKDLISKYAPKLWQSLKKTIANVNQPSLDIVEITRTIDDIIELISNFTAKPDEKSLPAMTAILALLNRISLQEAMTALADFENTQNTDELYKLCLKGLNLSQTKKEEIEEFADKLNKGLSRIKDVTSAVSLFHPILKAIKDYAKDASIAKVWAELKPQEALDKIDRVLEVFLKTDFDNAESINNLVKFVTNDLTLTPTQRISLTKYTTDLNGDYSHFKKIQKYLETHKGTIELARSLIKAYQSFYVTLKPSDLKVVFKRFKEGKVASYFAYKIISDETYKDNIETSIEKLNVLLKLVGLAPIHIPPESYKKPKGIANALIDRLLKLAERLDLLQGKELASVQEKWRELQDDWTKAKYDDLLKSLDPAIKNLHGKYAKLTTAKKEVLNLLRFRDGQISPDFIELSVSGANIVNQAVTSHPQMNPELRNILNGIEGALRLVPAVDIVKELEIHFKAMQKDVRDFIAFVKSFDISIGNWSNFRSELLSYKVLLFNHLGNVSMVLEKIKKQTESLNLEKVDVAAYIEKVQNIEEIIKKSFEKIEELKGEAEDSLVERMSGAAVEMQFRKLKTGQKNDQEEEIIRNDGHFQARFDFLLAGDDVENLDVASLYLPLRLQLGDGFFGGAELGLGGRLNILGAIGAIDGCLSVKNVKILCTHRMAEWSQDFDVGLMASASLYAEEIDPTGNGPRELSAGFRPRLGGYLDWSVAGVAKARLGAGWVGNIEFTGQDRFVETNKSFNLWLGISRPH